MLHSLKSKFILCSTLGLIGLLTLIFEVTSLTNRASQLALVDKDVNRLYGQMLQLRRDEKDFLARMDERYIQKFNQDFSKFTTNAAHINALFLQLGLPNFIKLSEIYILSNNYASSFKNITAAYIQLGLNENSGVRGQLRSSAHDVEKQLNASTSSNTDQQIITLLQMRRAEKDFFSRKDEKYINKHNALCKSLYAISPSQALSDYHAKFTESSELIIKIGTSENLGLLGDMRKAAHSIQDNISHKLDIISPIFEQKQKRITQFIWGVFIVLLLGLALLLFLLKRFILNPITHLTHTGQAIEQGDYSVRFEVKSHDELGRLADTFNHMAIAIEKDISLREDNEKKLLALKEASESATEAKTVFIDKMSHELRTPMNIIIGMTGLVLKTELTDRQQKCMDRVKESSDELLKALNNILDYSSIHKEQSAVISAPFELPSTINRILSVVGASAESEGIHLQLNIADDVPTLLIGDAEKLSKILRHIIDNAVKFTKKGDANIQVSMESQDSESAIILFLITDTGIGIREQQLETIFMPFHQGDNSVAREFEGAGMGLAVSKGIADLIGASIKIESEINKGTQVYLTCTFKVA